MTAYQFNEWRDDDGDGAWAYWCELDDEGNMLSQGMKAYIPTEQQLSVGNVPPASATSWSSGGC